MSDVVKDVSEALDALTAQTAEANARRGWKQAAQDAERINETARKARYEGSTTSANQSILVERAEYRRELRALGVSDEAIDKLFASYPPFRLYEDPHGDNQ